MIVASVTEDEDVIIAALLHDVIEDTDYSYEDIKTRYGKRVADLVQNETENKRNDQSRESTWVIRKQETIDHIEKADYDTKLICLGDKLSNIRASVKDYDSDRNSFWDRFNQSDPKFQGWYYQTLRDILARDFSESEAWKEYDELCRQLFGNLDVSEIKNG
jgi:myo-inositol-1(or 4)-monophosphatase